MTTEFSLNGERVTVEGDTQKPLLWVLREDLRLTGTKFGCGIGPVRRLHRAGRRRGGALLLVSARARRGQVRDHHRGPGGATACTRCSRPGSSSNVPQCGYCQPGQIMSAAALLAVNAAAERRRDRRRDGGNLCRCGTYPRIRRAIHRAAELLAAEQAESAEETVPPAEEVEP